MTQDPNPHEALASIQAARESVGRDLDYPVSWDMLYGLVMALLVGGQGLPTLWASLTFVVAMLGVVLSMQWWRKHYGWWVNGYSPRKARWVAFGMVAFILPLMGLSLWTRLGDGPWWLPLLAAGLAWIAAVVGGRLWLHVWRKELAEGVR